ncbi:MAG: excinuclease ABC subunit UvrA [Chlamydiota bacterium]|nr:excinuclease ABC subunit UvrA [Chlamydiota bacterium]
MMSSPARDFPGCIKIRGAFQNNLKGINVDIAHHQFVVVTGPSGSGKSSLVVDTLYAESKRRFLENLSFFSRQTLGSFQRPLVDAIDGLLPAILISAFGQRISSRSTIGTVTDIHDLLRLLFIRIGTQFCEFCNAPVLGRSVQEMVQTIMTEQTGKKILISVPLYRHQNLEHDIFIRLLKREGILKIISQGCIYEIDACEESFIEKDKILAVIDRIDVEQQNMQRMNESIEFGMRLSHGLCQIWVEEQNLSMVYEYSEMPYCFQCRREYKEPHMALLSFNRPEGACSRCHGLGMELTKNKELVCRICCGGRFNKLAGSIRIGDLNLAELSLQPINKLTGLLDSLNNSSSNQVVAEPILKSIQEKISVLLKLGLGYLELHRGLDQISIGERQKVGLSIHLCSNMSGLLYIFDEPTRGLHPDEIGMLVQELHQLRERFNTVVVIEHDLHVIQSADRVLALGPGSGPFGGSIVGFNNDRCMANLSSYRKNASSSFFSAEGSLHNIKEMNVELPLQCLCGVSGMSGSGKSTLVHGIVVPLIKAYLSGKRPCIRIKGQATISRIINVQQEDHVRSGRSCVVTIGGVFDQIRQLFSQVPEARVRGYTPGRFSLNVKGGRCESCEGMGKKNVKMVFLADMFLVCDACVGKRFNSETLSVTYRGKNIHAILEMDVEEGKEFFKNIAKIHRFLDHLYELGAGYLKLGQMSQDLSSGEIQRINLAKAMARPSLRDTVFVFDEPTCGLGIDEIEKLLMVLYRLRDAGNHIIVIEHNLDFLRLCDYLIEMGPGSGDQGGKIIAQGIPEDIKKNTNSITGKYL